MQAVQVTIDSKFSLQLQCPVHSAHGVISFCTNESCIQPLCLLCIAEHCQSHYFKQTQPRLEDAAKVYLSCSEELQRAAAKAAELREKLAAEGDYAKREQEILSELETCRQSVLRLVNRAFDDRVREIHESSFAVSFSLKQIEEKLSKMSTELSVKERGAQALESLLKNKDLEAIPPELGKVEQLISDKSTLCKNLRIIVEQEAVEKQVREALEKYVRILEEKMIFDAVSATSNKPVQEQKKNFEDLDQRLSRIKSQLMGNIGETSKGKRPLFSQSASWRDAAKSTDSLTEKSKSSSKPLGARDELSEKVEASSPSGYTDNIDVKKEDCSEPDFRKIARTSEASQSSQQFRTPKTSRTMEEESRDERHSSTHLKQSARTVSHLSIPIKVLESPGLSQEERSEFETDTANLPNESIFNMIEKRVSIEALSQDSAHSLGTRSVDNKEFFSIDQLPTELDSDTHSKCDSVTNDQELQVYKQIPDRAESDFVVDTANDIEDDKVGLLFYFQWRSKLLHMLQLDRLDQTNHPRFETYPLNIDFLIPDYHGAILLPDKRIFMIGGQSLSKQNFKHKETYQLDLEHKRLTLKASMSLGRDSHAICYNNGYIYVLGGVINDSNGKEPKKVVTDKCERYDVANDSWSDIKSMDAPVCNHCCCVFSKKYIFTFGGRTSSTKLTNKIMRYDIQQDTWLTLHMKAGDRGRNFVLTSQACCRQINSKHIFIFGGYSEERNISSQSFVLEVDENEEKKGRRGFEIKYINKKRLIFAAPFWEKQPVIYNKKLYCLQNVITHTNPKLSYCTSRRVISFDGKKWSSIC